MSRVIVKLKKQDLNKIQEICKEHNNHPRELINILQEAQLYFGYLPAEVQEAIAQQLDIAVAQVYGVVTFYSFFTMIPQGENPISICTGTACYVRGADTVLQEFKKQLGIKVGETTEDGKFSLNCLRCVGACGLAPVVLVGETTYKRVAPDEVKNILAEYQEVE